MRKILLFLVAVMFFGSIEAQLRFGVKAGVNFSKFNSEEQTLNKDGAAWQVGLASQFKIPIVGLGIQP
ncbi:MAG: porin family protein, partial [Bacteroidales bacterium]|nr:porin family protein [Bacteroidales bacterium]